ncbi:MAG: hypothetical protein SGJ13_09630 [Actinomycetota bacterium]|nr:hypothetical protein [Actinomycetota bacterium]
MPTDPYVPADPSARPRQQQNLPPGIALPPAKHWVADRPGDLGPRQPRGQLYGSPGPNVGYAYTLAERAAGEWALATHEERHDVIPVIAEIAGKRAALFGRAPVMPDVSIAAGLLGYDGTAEPDFAQVRRLIVHDAGHDYTRRRAIVDTVPEQLLRMTAEEFNASINEWRHLTRTRLFPELGRTPTM